MGSPEIMGEDVEVAGEEGTDLRVSPLAGQRLRKPAAVKRISIFGLGYVGAVSLACLARDGHRVIGVDVDPVKLELIRARKSPILEEGIQELMRDVVDSGRVSVTQDARRAVEETVIDAGVAIDGNRRGRRCDAKQIESARIGEFRRV